MKSPRVGLVESPPLGEVGNLARRGAAWSAGLILGQYSVRLASTAILARILLPSDYGLVGMAGVLTAFLLQFADGGLSWATVQRQDLTERQVHGLFWVNVAGGALLWTVCLVGAPVVARFFEREELTNIVATLGASFVLSGLSVQPLALLRRQMRFKGLSLIEIVSQLAAAFVGVGMALAGFGYWALVGQALASPLLRTILAFVVSGYRPERPGRRIGLSSLLSFGGYLAAYGLVNYFARNLDNILVGKVWGAEALGYYGRAYFLMTLPSLLVTATLSQVMVPSLSRLQGDRQRLGHAYRRAVRLIGFIGFPVAGGLAVTAPEFVQLIYGPKWIAVVPVLFWLAIAAISQPIHNTMGWLFVAVGKAREMFAWGLVASLVLGVAFFVGVRWGPEGVAASYAFTMTFLLTIPALWMSHRAADLKLTPTLLPLLPSLLAMMVMMAGTYALGSLMTSTELGWELRLAAKVAVGVVLYGMCTALWLRDVWSQLLADSRAILGR